VAGRTTVLNAHAERVAPLLVDAFPRHSEAITVDEQGDVSIEIECPSRSVDAGLSIWTWNEDVVVGFHTHHAHFSDWGRSGADDYIEAAIRTANEVLVEKLVVVSWYLRGQPEPDITMFEATAPALAEFQRWSQPTIGGWLRRRVVRPWTGWLPHEVVNRLRRVDVTLRSWEGTYNVGRTQRD